MNTRSYEKFHMQAVHESIKVAMAIFFHQLCVEHEGESMNCSQKGRKIESSGDDYASGITRKQLRSSFLLISYKENGNSARQIQLFAPTKAAVRTETKKLGIPIWHSIKHRK